MGRACSPYGEKMNSCRRLVRKPEGKRPRSRYVGDIKMDLRDVGWGGMDWINLARGRDQWRALVNTRPKNVRKFLNS
jgi:hypothetical protein